MWRYFRQLRGEVRGKFLCGRVVVAEEYDFLTAFDDGFHRRRNCGHL